MDLIIAFVSLFEGNGKFVLGLASGSGIVWQFVASPLKKERDASNKELKEYYIKELEFYRKLSEASKNA